MKIQLAYGKKGLSFEIGDEVNAQIIQPRFVDGLPDAEAALAQALAQPMGCEALREMVNAQQKIGIIFNDITRATPNDIILPAVLKAIKHVPVENITLFNALGTHRPNTEAELRTMLGDDLVDAYGDRIIQNNPFEQGTQINLGQVSTGNQVWINRELAACDFVILTGFIEPHFFAGFSGGGKAIMPGMAGLETILGNHSAATLDSPKAIWGITEGNPLWEEIHEIVALIPNKFLVNVTMNNLHEITGVFAGDLHTAHNTGCEFMRKTAMVEVDQPFDIVVTTNSGYPLDLNLYQTVKGISAAMQVVREDGAILVASECWDGIPEHGLFGKLLIESKSPQELLERIRNRNFRKLDQWQAHILATALGKANIYLYSEHLDDEQIRDAMLQPSSSLEETLAQLLEKYGEDARVCVLPEGPLTIPYIARIKQGIS